MQGYRERHQGGQEGHQGGQEAQDRSRERFRSRSLSVILQKRHGREGEQFRTNLLEPFQWALGNKGGLLLPGI